MFSFNPNLPKLAEPIPDSCSVEEFLFNEEYGRHPTAESKDPLVCAISGRTFSFHELKSRVDFLARGLSESLGWGPDSGTQWEKVVCTYAVNAVSNLTTLFFSFPSSDMQYSSILYP